MSSDIWKSDNGNITLLVSEIAFMRDEGFMVYMKNGQTIQLTNKNEFDELLNEFVVSNSY